MKRIALLLVLWCPVAHAGGPFFDVGLGYAIDTDITKGKSCLMDWKKNSGTWGCSESPLGYAAIGYQSGKLSVSIEHWSSLREFDAGLDVVSIKYRFSR